MKWCLRTCKHSSCLLLVMSLGKLADTKSAAQECQLGEAVTPVAALCSSSQWHSSINGAVERNLSGKRSFSRSVFTCFFVSFWGCAFWLRGTARLCCARWSSSGVTHCESLNMFWPFHTRMRAHTHCLIWSSGAATTRRSRSRSRSFILKVLQRLSGRLQHATTAPFHPCSLYSPFFRREL